MDNAIFQFSDRRKGLKSKVKGNGLDLTFVTLGPFFVFLKMSEV